MARPNILVPAAWSTVEVSVNDWNTHSPMHCRYYAAVGKEVDALKPNSITLSWSQTGPRLVADVQRAGIWPIIQLGSSELAHASRSATGLRPASDLSATRIA